MQSDAGMFCGQRLASFGQQRTGTSVELTLLRHAAAPDFQKACLQAMAMLQVQKQQGLSQEPDDGGNSSIWDWEPPGDLAETGAWKVLRELAMTLTKYA